MKTTLKFNFNKINESIFHFFGAGIFKDLHPQANDLCQLFMAGI
jgi:hypothetical protein